MIKKNIRKIREEIRKAHLGLSKKNKKRILTLEFLTRLMILAIPLYIVMYGNISLYFIEDPLANIVTSMLKTSGVETTRTNGYETNGLLMPVLQISGFEKGIGIARACTGYRSLFALIALIFAVPRIKIRKKLNAIIVFTPILMITNIIRIYTTLLIGSKIGIRSFEFVHTFLWRETLIFLIILLWVIWLAWVKNVRIMQILRKKTRFVFATIENKI